MFQTGRLHAVNGSALEMAFDYALHVDMINQDKNRRLLEKILEEIYGKPLYVKGFHAQQESQGAVADLLENFGGQVV